MNNMTTAYIGLGSNQGNSEKFIKAVIKLIANSDKFGIPVASSLYETTPVDNENQPNFINAVVKVDTELSPESLLKFLLAVERSSGRIRDPENPKGPRAIDCDLLLYGREQIKKEALQVPHPRMMKRLFVMEPLLEIAPKAYIPSFGYVKDVFEESQRLNLFSTQTVTKLV